MIRAAIAIFLTALLSACAAPAKPKVEQEVVTVYVKVKEPCIEADEVPKRPAYKFGKVEKPKSEADMARMLAEDFENAEQYGVRWEAAAAGCLVVKPANNP